MREKAALPRIEVTQSAAALHSILRDDVNMVVWQRNPSLLVKTTFAALAEKMRGEFRAHASEANFAGQLDSFLANFQTTVLEREIVIGEIGLLLSLLLSLQQARTVQIVFGHISSDHCRLFHADHNSLRLVCTFFGKGTEFLRNEDVNRAGLGKGTNDGHIPVRPIQRLNLYDVGLMKGELFPGNQGRGVVHRSPPLLPSDTCRLFLAIDSCDDFLSRKKGFDTGVTTKNVNIHKIPFPARK